MSQSVQQPDCGTLDKVTTDNCLDISSVPEHVDIRDHVPSHSCLTELNKSALQHWMGSYPFSYQEICFFILMHRNWPGRLQHLQICTSVSGRCVSYSRLQVHMSLTTSLDVCLNYIAGQKLVFMVIFFHVFISLFWSFNWYLILMVSSSVLSVRDHLTWNPGRWVPSVKTFL